MSHYNMVSVLGSLHIYLAYMNICGDLRTNYISYPYLSLESFNIGPRDEVVKTLNQNKGSKHQVQESVITAVSNNLTATDQNEADAEEGKRKIKHESLNYSVLVVQKYIW